VPNLPTFPEVKDAVLTEVLPGTNAYALLTMLALPMRNQPRLREHYPFLVGNLVDALTGQVLMTVSPLAGGCRPYVDGSRIHLFACEVVCGLARGRERKILRVIQLNPATRRSGRRAASSRRGHKLEDLSHFDAQAKPLSAPARLVFLDRQRPLPRRGSNQRIAPPAWAGAQRDGADRLEPRDGV